MRRAGIRPIFFLIVWSTLSSVWAFEASSITTSTVIGTNFGAPAGMERDAFPPPGKPALAVETLIFIKNLEISGLSDEGIEGETVIQSLVPARFFYRAGERTRIELGVVAGHKFGDDKAVDILFPLARIVHEPAADMFLVAGTLFPTHPIHDALIDDIRKFGVNDAAMVFKDPSEQGFQFRVDRRRFKQDLWINWKVREEKETREEFEAASVSVLKFFEEAMWLNFQARVVHIGGQKNDLDLGVDENRSMLAALSWGRRAPFGISAINDLRLRAGYLSSADNTMSRGTRKGEGYEIGFSGELLMGATVRMVLDASHYSGSRFYSRDGDPLYRLDRYTQVGVTSLFTLDKGFLIETGVTGQVTENKVNFSFMVTFLWGHGFF